MACIPIEGQQIHLKLNQIGLGTLIVGDADISMYVNRITLTAKPGELTRLEVTLSAGVAIECPAEVTAVLEKLNRKTGLVESTAMDAGEYKSYAETPNES